MSEQKQHFNRDIQRKPHCGGEWVWAASTNRGQEEAEKIASKLNDVCGKLFEYRVKP